MTAFKKWYAQHGQELSERRRKRYQEDPEYRARQLQQAKLQREKRRKAKPERKPGYDLSSIEVAEALGITPFVLRDLRLRGLYPRPYEHQGRLYFTQTQVGLIGQLIELLETLGRRPTEAQKQQLADKAALIYANWE